MDNVRAKYYCSKLNLFNIYYLITVFDIAILVLLSSPCDVIIYRVSLDTGLYLRKCK